MSRRFADHVYNLLRLLLLHFWLDANCILLPCINTCIMTIKLTPNHGVKKKTSSEWQLSGWRVWEQSKITRLFQTVKATVAHITSRYKQVMQKRISEHTTHQTLTQMGNSSRWHQLRTRNWNSSYYNIIKLGNKRSDESISAATYSCESQHLV